MTPTPLRPRPDTPKAKPMQTTLASCHGNRPRLAAPPDAPTSGPVPSTPTRNPGPPPPGDAPPASPVPPSRPAGSACWPTIATSVTSATMAAPTRPTTSSTSPPAASTPKQTWPPPMGEPAPYAAGAATARKRHAKRAPLEAVGGWGSRVGSYPLRVGGGCTRTRARVSRIIPVWPSDQAERIARRDSSRPASWARSSRVGARSGPPRRQPGRLSSAHGGTR